VRAAGGRGWAQRGGPGCVDRRGLRLPGDRAGG